jgi:hypothetical protein
MAHLGAIGRNELTSASNLGADENADRRCSVPELAVLAT